MRTTILIAALALLLTATGCTGSTEDAPRHIDRADLYIASYPGLDSAARAEGVRNLYRPLRTLARVYGYDQPDEAVLEWLSGSDMVAMFQPDIDSVYKDLGQLEHQLGCILGNAGRQGLHIPEIQYATVAWGKAQPVLRDSDVVLIALNHFLGEDYPGYSHLQPYRRIGKTPQALPYALARVLVCTQYPMVPDQNTTLLDWMLYEGAVAEAVMRLVPDAKETGALELTEAQLAFANSHEKQMYRELAAQQLLYDKSPYTADRYIGAAPNTPLIGGQAPGRAGRYLGYRIVQSYLKAHPDTGLEELLSAGFRSDRKALSEYH